MNDLQQVRAELDQVDREIVRLFEKRMALVCRVAEYKIAHGMPVLDASREEQVLASRAALLEDKHLDAAVRDLFRELMRLSRAEQEVLLREAEK